MANIIIILILLALVGGACIYIRKQKKKGIRCIGCPQAGKCNRSCGDAPKMGK